MVTQVLLFVEVMIFKLAQPLQKGFHRKYYVGKGNDWEF